MRLIRFGPVGNEKPGVIDHTGSRRDLSSHFKDWDMAFFGSDDIASFGRDRETRRGEVAACT